MRAPVVTVGLLSAIAILHSVPEVLGRHRDSSLWARVPRAVGVLDGEEYERGPHAAEDGGDPDPEARAYSYPPYGYPPPPPEEPSSVGPSSWISSGKTSPELPTGYIEGTNGMRHMDVFSP